MLEYVGATFIGRKRIDHR